MIERNANTQGNLTRTIQAACWLNDNAVYNSSIRIRSDGIETIAKIRVIAEDAEGQELRFHRKRTEQLRRDIGIDGPALRVGGSDSDDTKQAGVIGMVTRKMVGAAEIGIELGIDGRNVETQIGINVVNLISGTACKVNIFHTR